MQGCEAVQLLGPSKLVSIERWPELLGCLHFMAELLETVLYFSTVRV